MLTKIMALLLACALLLATGTTVALRQAENRAVKATQAAALYQRNLETEKAAVGRLKLSLDAQTLATNVKAKELARVNSINKQQKVALDEALKANRAWAEQPVPSSVWDAVTHRDD